ncbi:universal stress protein [Aequorivita antarctica]|uniref:Universal stress protein n=1 Tax=Aequorivita antarctica TaxID=153266 RepID=A0A5C6Z192_9FLAO|nr:universal stress protein [Aequorivita antarctica]TXD73455.1 universal stress protein [Aequorivita antarctica]SRX75759.1 hypothetical protein AEQU3_02755 [Aequorivita antarctica]
MKNILLPTDFSLNALNAIEYAIQLFKDEDCTFHLLNTFTPMAYNVATLADSYSTMMIEEINRQNSETGLLEIEKQLKKKFNNPKHAFQTLASFNLLVSEIKAVVKERNIDLIVMGTKGATGAQEVFLGTNTMYTIKKVKCAVIAVPANMKYEKPKEILFPTDFKFSMENKYLKLLKSICTKHISRLNILNIYFGVPLDSSQEKVKDQFEVFFKDNAHLFHTAEYEDITEAVAQFQIKYKANFLVMINNKHSFFENLFFKQVIKEMVYHTNVPFMVIPSTKLMKS